MSRRALGVACALALGGCSGPSGSPDPAAALKLVPAPDGIDVAPTGREIGFGRHRPGAEAAVARVLGRPGRPAPCAAPGLSATGWPRTGLTLVFDARDAFVGWRTEGGPAPAPEASAGRTCEAIERAG